MARQGDREAGDTFSGARSDLPTVGLDDGTRDRKSEPCAFTARFALGATAMEAFENPFDLIGGYRVADIRDGETDAG